MNIALIRHGKTASNLRGAFTGKRDESISEHAAAELADIEYPKVDVLFSSPMRRCIETSRIIYPELEPVIVDGLRERDFGDFEGKTHADIIVLPGFSDWGMNEKGMIFPNGEDFDEFNLRCMDAFTYTLEQMKAMNAKNAAVVCHGGVIMAILSELIPTAQGYFHWQSKNGCGFLLETDAKNLKDVSVKGSIGR